MHHMFVIRGNRSPRRSRMILFHWAKTDSTHSMSHTPRGESGWASAFPHIAAYSSCRFDVQPSALSAFFILFLSFFKINVSDTCLRMHPSRNFAPQIQNFFWFRMPSPVPLDLMKSSSFDPRWPFWVFSHGVCLSGHPKSQSVQRVVHEAAVAKGSQPLDPLAACDGILGIPNCSIRAAISTQRCVNNKYIYRDLRWCHVCVTACTHI